jgi:hypothetical protein
MRPLALFVALEERTVWRGLASLDEALAAPTGARGGAPVEAAYLRLVRALIGARRADVGQALASALLEDRPPVALGGALPAGVGEAALSDLRLVSELLRRDWHGEARPRAHAPLPPLAELAGPTGDAAWRSAVEALATTLRERGPEDVLAWLQERARSTGFGPAARFVALRWREGRLRGIAHPDLVDDGVLVGIDDQLRRLRLNTEALLAGRPAHNTLLYGPRGSGKSTAVRGLLTRFAGRGLRLLEVPAERLDDLPAVIEAVRGQPQRFVLYVDDLSFEGNDRRYHPLKTVLEGSLSLRPENVVLYATSNRRHLLGEHHSDRPELGDEDVHAWDTHNERLALADRFGLTLTFPSASQRRYLEIVRTLARAEGIEEDSLDTRAVRFADWGNGYSGRTARQFIDAVLQERATGPA